jgi:acyl-coenzyme A synthetase/AMP-(fatty) acid ligase
MLGYLDDPVATARALRNGFLHTGDMAYMDEEGYLFIVGRQTEMIKSGGHRIGPQEIEEVIAAIPGVAECAVVGVADDFLGQAIVASVVLSDGAHLDDQAVKRACFAELPRYKMPTEVRFVSELPRSDRGKVLRSVLRKRLEEERGLTGLHPAFSRRPEASRRPVSGDRNRRR